MNLYVLKIDKLNGINENYYLNAFPNKYQKIIKQEKKEHSLGSLYLLNEILHLEEKDILYNQYGKPYSINIYQQFNISHSGDYVILGVSDFLVGVDIENIKEFNLKVMEKVFTLNEIKSVKEKKDFFKIWTLKESASKLIGKGFNIQFKSFDVNDLLKGNSIILEDKTIYGRAFELDSYIISVTSENEMDVKNVEINYL